MRGVLAAVAVAGVIAVPDAAWAADELAPVMVVLDASGSMTERLAGGGTKMAAAKDAVHTLVGQVPDGARLGLTVYGTGTGNAPADKEAGCRDVRVVHKVGPVDRDALNAAVDGVEPRGYTPIGQSLRVAAAELPTQGPRSVVLVSDGEDTCAPPDPCDVAKELANAGADLRIHAVGFDVDDTARRQLACVAAVTGGTYVDARDAGALGSVLNRITQRALRSYAPVGTPVTGTPEPAGAPALRPGDYLDRIGPDESRFYTVDVPAGYTLYATASAILAGGGDYLVRVSRYDGDTATDCPGRATQIKTEGPVGSAVLRWTAPGSGGKPCDRPGIQLIRVNLDAVGTGDDSSTVELLIGLEPPLSGDPGPPGSTDRARFSPPGGPAKPVTGGGSFSTATALDGSGAYTETVLAGEMVFYRVRLGWEQGLAYRLRLGRQPAVGGVFVKTAWYNPARDQRGTDAASYDGRERTLPAADPLSGPPVRYRNRDLPGTDAGAGASLAGWYYIGVLVDKAPRPVQVPMTLEVSVTGDAQPGPRYHIDAGNDPFGDQSGGPANGDAPAGDLWSTVTRAGPLLWIGIALILFGLAVAVALTVRRRRGRGLVDG